MTAGGIALFVIICALAALICWAIAQEIPRT